MGLNSSNDLDVNKVTLNPADELRVVRNEVTWIVNKDCNTLTVVAVARNVCGDGERAGMIAKMIYSAKPEKD